ncbi:MAG TPA: hypothetical protein VGH50_13070 [Candidatus Binatia bacterium]
MMQSNVSTGGFMLDDMASMFQPDSLLPVQYFENFRRKVETEPEKRLLLAVLEDALACYQKHFSSRGGRGMRLFRETEEWIFREDSTRPFSFTNICEVVGFDPQYIRNGLLKWREMRIEEISKMAFDALPPKTRIKLPQPRRIERTRMIGLRV